MMGSPFYYNVYVPSDMAIGDVFHDCMWSGVCACCQEPELHGATTTVVVKPMGARLDQEERYKQEMISFATAAMSQPHQPTTAILAGGGSTAPACLPSDETKVIQLPRPKEIPTKFTSCAISKVRAQHGNGLVAIKQQLTSLDQGGPATDCGEQSAAAATTTTSITRTQLISNISRASNTGEDKEEGGGGGGEEEGLVEEEEDDNDDNHSNANKNTNSHLSKRRQQQQQQQRLGALSQRDDFTVVAAKKLRHREVEKNRHRQLQAMVKTLSEKIPGRVDKETQVQTMRRAARYRLFLRDVLAAAAHGKVCLDKMEKIYLRSCDNVDLIMSQQF